MYTYIFLNIVTMYAMQKTASLPKTLKNLSFSIAISDVGFGLLSQPVYSSLLVKWSQLNHPSCNNYGVFYISANLFFASSFLSVVDVSVDRFLAVHLHLRYQELVTQAYCYCGDFHMGLEYICFFHDVLGITRHSGLY